MGANYEKPELEYILLCVEQGYGGSRGSFGIDSITEVEGEW